MAAELSADHIEGAGARANTKHIACSNLIKLALTCRLLTSVIQPTSAQYAWLSPARPPPPARPVVLEVPGNEQLLRQENRVDQIILPYEEYPAPGKKEDFSNSYVIDHKRFVEPYSSRCFASTLLEDPDSVEPIFVLIRPKSEVSLAATAPMSAIRAAHFDPKLRTTILVHGFTQSYPTSDWLRKARALYETHHLLERENLIIMNWGASSSGSYSQVAAIVSGMGSFLANFLMKLIEIGADRRSIHLIGHSLGAHLAGFAGKRVRPQLGRITALDPAGPCFGKFFSNSANDRLSHDDALEVDVFHYDDSFLGLATPIGHFDVYVNGGHSQPGAVDNMNAMVQALITMMFRRNRNLSESHTRSTEVATSELGSGGCQEMAYECRDWPAFLVGECGQCDEDNNQCFLMSFHFQYPNMDLQPLRRPPKRRSSERLYIATSANEPFCLHHFQVLVKFEAAPDLATQAKRNRWRLALDMVNERNERANLTLLNQMAPNVFSYLLLSEMAPSRWRSASLQVRQGTDNSVVQLRDERHHQGRQKARPYSQPYRVESVEINFMSHVEARVRRSLSSRLCPAGWLVAGPSLLGPNSIAVEPDDEWLALKPCERRH